MRTLLATMITIVVGACGPSGSGMSGGDDDDGDGNGGSDSGPPATCTNASDCGGDQVCSPDGNVCADDVPCSTAAECGNGGVCGEGGTCVPNETGGECVGTENCLEGETCNDGHCGCNGVAFQAEPVVPNMLIVFDRSNSMNQAGGGGKTKWTIAKEALNVLLDDHGGNVRFGLDMFASNNDCNAGQINVGIGDNTAGMISNTIADASAASNTPIRSTMAALKNYNGLKDTAHPNYVLLITDGEESCSGLFDPPPSTPVAQLRSQTPSIKTYVVGFGSGVSASQLNDIAVKGGTALAGPTKYYQANDAAQLSDALNTILGTVLSCTYTLDQVPEDLAELYVYQDDAPISQDPTHANGWDYDPATGELTFYGAACDALEGGDVTDLAIVYGCPNPDVE
jgi:hypothetical protein